MSTWSTIISWVDEYLPPTQLTGDAAAVAENWTADAPGTYCRRCGATCAAEAQTLSGCPHCRGTRPAWSGVWRLSGYHAPLSQWILAMKFRHGSEWAPWFGRQLAGQIIGEASSGGAGRNVIVPVPLHWSRRMRRGYDQAQLVAEGLAKGKRWPIARMLHRRKRTAAQSDIHNHALRIANVRRAFGVAATDLSGWTVWLVDDVKTTGATARACAKLLRQRGADRVNLVVVAVADPKGSDFTRK